MAKIIGNTTATPNPRPDWNQTDETKADYIKNKPNVVTQEVDPTVPAWAKEPTKPSYTAEEVGALSEDTTLAELPDDVDHRTVSDNEKTTWNEKFDKAGGTINGDLVVAGDLIVNGTTTSEDHETIVVEDNMMVLNSNKVDLQTAVSGIAMNKNADSTYGAVYDPVDDTFKFGEGTLNEANEFEFNDGEGLPFAVREDSTQFTDGHLVEWSADGNKLVDSGKTVEDFSLNGHGHIIDDVDNLQETLDTKAILGEELINTDVAYIKDVLNTSASYAEINKIGGMTRKCTNLLKLLEFNSDIAGVGVKTNPSANTVVINGTATSNGGRNIKIGQVTLKAGTYKLSSQVPYICVSNSTTNAYIAGLNPFTLTEETTVHVGFNFTQGETYNTTIDIWLNEGGVELPFEPYFKGLRDAKVTAVKSVGRNLHNPNTDTLGKYKDPTYGTHPSSSAFYTDYVRVKPSTKYTYSAKISYTYFYDANKQRISFELDKNQITTPSNCYYIVWSGFRTDPENWQVCEGSEAPTDLTYTEHTLEIPQIDGNGLGTRDTIYNYYDFEKKTFTRKCKKAIFNGTENWTKRSDTEHSFQIGVSLILPNTYQVIEGISNIYVFQSSSEIDTMNGIYLNYTSAFIVTDLSATTLEEFKSNLAKSPIECVCRIENPEIENISNLITSDSLIGVEGGGTLTFENEYNYDVPSEVMFHLNNNKEISANEFIGDLKGKALWADHSNHSDEADHAEQATNADHSNHSDEADHAEQADYAKFDSNGNIIADTYTVLSEELINNDITYVKDVPNESASYVEINKIGGMSYKSINIWDEQWEIGFIQTGNGQNASSVVRIRSKNHFSCLPNTQYYISGITDGDIIMYEYGADKSFIRVTYLYKNKFTTAENTRYLRLVLNENYGTTYKNNICINVSNEEHNGKYYPYFDGFRNAKVSAVKSVGVNMVKQPYSFGSQTIQGVTITVNSDNSITFNGTSTGDIALNMGQVFLRKDVSYTINGIKNLTEAQALFYVKTGGFFDKLLINSNGAVTKTCLKDGMATLELYIYRGTTIKQTVYPMLNEGTEALPYSPYTEHTLEIPEEIQSLDGYGLGIDETYNNYVDLINKKFHRVVDKVDLSTLTWTLENDLYWISKSLTDIKYVSSNTEIGNALWENGTIRMASGMYMSMNGELAIDTTRIACNNGSTTDTPTGFLVYELAIPTTEDIYDLITDDSLIDVECGGTLTFVNEYGYDVPSEVEFHLNNNMEISANEFIGDLKGEAVRAKRANEASHAARADYATYDENGKNIKDNYASTGTSEIVESDTYIVDIPNDEQLANNAKIHKIGGMSRKCTNLLNLNTLVITGNNTYTINTETGRVNVKFTGVHSPLRWRVKVPKNTTLTLGFDSYSGANATVQISDTLQAPSGGTETIDGKISLGTGLKSVSVNTGNYNELTVSVYIPAGSNFDVDIVGLRVNESNSLLPFEPYFSGLRDAKVTAVKSVGRNLFGGEVFADKLVSFGGTKNTSNGTVYISAGNASGKIAYANFKENTQYTFIIKASVKTIGGVNFKIYYTDGTTFVMRIETANTPTTVRAVSTSGKTVESFKGEWQADTHYYYNECGIFEGDLTINDFKPYTEHTITIPEAVQNKEWYGIGIPNTEYYNSIDLENGKGDIKAKEIVLNGTENFLISKLTDYHYFYVPIGDVGVKPNTDLLCDQYDSVNEATRDKTCFVGSGGIAIRDDRFATANDFKTYLAEQYANGTPVTLICAMATPTTENIASTNIIGVEVGGSIEFVNEHNYDVNSTLEFYYGKKDRVHIDEIIGDLKGTATYAELSKYSKKTAHAEIADQATKATQDGNGNVIADTYLSKNNLGFTTNVNTKNYKVQADANNNLYVNVPWEGGGEGADGNYYHVPEFPSGSGIKIGAGSGIADMYVPVDTALNDTSENPVQNKVIHAVVANLERNAFSGNYNDLINIPSQFEPSAHDHDYIPTLEKGVAKGVAELDENGKVPTAQLPSYVDESAYTHSQTTSGNPHKVTKSDVGLGNVVNTSDSATPVEGGTTKFTTGGAYTELSKKVDKVNGKGLSTNDYTTPEQTKLAGIEDGANKYTLPAADSSLGGVKSGGDVTISNGIITVNDDSHNHIISNVDDLQSTLDGKVTRITNMSNMPSPYGFAMAREGDTVGVSGGSDNYYVVLDSSNTLKTGIQINGASKVTWQEISKVGHTHDYLPLSGGTLTKSLILNNGGTGESPALIFRRGEYLDTTTDWRLFVNSGNLYFNYANASGWKDSVYIKDGTNTIVGNLEGNADTSTYTGTTWTCPTSVGKWSRLCKINNYSSLLLTVSMSQSSQVSYYTYLINTGYGCGRIVQLNGTGFSTYSQQKIRLVQNTLIECFVELYNDYGYNGATLVNVDCRVVKLSIGGTVSPVEENTPNTASSTVWHSITSNCNKIVADIDGSAETSRKLANRYTERITNGNLSIAGDGSLILFKATSSMTTGKPTGYGDSTNGVGDGHVMHLEWDNTGGYSGQIFLGTGTADGMQYRQMVNKTWQPWVRLIDSNNIGSYGYCTISEVQTLLDNFAATNILNAAY